MSAEKNITRKDVAEKAGVSVSVVSRVLNNSGYVDKEKKKKIIKIAEQLGYIPNPIAMALQTRRTYQIIFFCNDLTGPIIIKCIMEWRRQRKKGDIIFYFKKIMILNQ